MKKLVQEAFTEEDLLAMEENSVSDLAEEIRNGKSERLLNYLSFIAKFPKASHRNRILILEQMPHATRLLSYTQWKEAGYQVAKGEVGIRVFMPLLWGNKEKRNFKGIGPVSQFDVSQLIQPDQDRVPRFTAAFYSNLDTLYLYLQTLAIKKGYRYLFLEESATEETRKHERSEDYLQEHNAAHDKVLAGIHTITHVMLHREAEVNNIKAKECHIEAASYAIACYFELPYAYSKDHLAFWSTTEELLNTELKVVGDTAGKIIRGVDDLAKPIKGP